MIFTDIRTPQHLKDYTLPKLASTSDEAFVGEAERYLDYVPPYIPISLYMEYRRSGNRNRYENAYLEKRKALSALVLGEYVERKGRFLDKIIDTVYSILQETTWTPGAHNTYVRDTKTMMLPTTRRPIIDLLAAETGATLAVTHRILGELLGDDEEYRNLFVTIEDEIGDRIIVPYLTDHFWWMGDGSYELCNWSSWCTENVLLCFFLLPRTQRERDKAFRQALYTLDRFVKDYGEDGGCNEGVAYFRHAGLSLLNAMDILNQVSGGALEDCFRVPKIRNIATYLERLHVHDDYFINYADCSAKPGRAGYREFFAGKLTDNPRLMSFAKAQIEASPERERLCFDDFSFYHRYLVATLEQEVAAYVPLKYEPAATEWFPSIGLLVRRNGTYVLSIKGGDNADSHNHNDVGSLTLYKQGQPLLVDIGVEVYTSKTFSESRYEIWTMRSSYHNTVNFCGIEEKPGEAYRAEHMSIDGDTVSLSLEKAYGDPRVQNYVRTVRFAEDGITVNESLDAEEKRILTLMSARKPEVRGNRIGFGELAEATLCNAFDAIEVEEHPIDDALLDGAWGKGSKLYRIAVTFSGDMEWRIV